MGPIAYLFISLLLQFYPVGVFSINSDRKVWSVCNNETEENCQCGDSLDYVILCSNNTLQFQPCYCLYYDLTENKTIAGTCLLTCYKAGHEYYKGIPRYSVQNATEFNHKMCSTMTTNLDADTNREGRFCGKCKKGYGLAVYSYHYISCIPCKDYSYKSWLRYFAVAFLPLTLFYFVVVLLKIDFTSSRLTGSVFVIQCLLSSQKLKAIDTELYAPDYSAYRHAIYFAFSLTGMLNLDFFRLVYPYFCLHPDFNFLHVVLLDFFVALYPFFLIFLTYLLVTMYDRNYRLVVWAWIPFKCCLKQRGRNVKGSLVKTFASFILLSSVKILGVCFDILTPTISYDTSGVKLTQQYLYYDATIEYFGSEHWPFAVLALIIAFMFVFLPFLLLVLYPCRCFQRALNCLGWKCQVLHIFMDVFQGSYKTEPRDLRYFSAYYILLRFLTLLVMSIRFSPSSYIVSAVVMVIATTTFALFQPYKNSADNKINVLLLQGMVLLFVSLDFGNVAMYLDRYWITFANYLYEAVLTYFTLVSTLQVLAFSIKLLKPHIWKVCKRREDSIEASALIQRDVV